MFEAVINGEEGVFDREDEAGGELLEPASRVHQCGGIGQKVAPGHAIVPALGRLGQPASFGVEPFRLCYVGGDTPEELRRGLDDPAYIILGQVASSKDGCGMVGQVQSRSAWRARGCRLFDGHAAIIYKYRPD